MIENERYASLVCKGINHTTYSFVPPAPGSRLRKEKRLLDCQILKTTAPYQTYQKGGAQNSHTARFIKLYCIQSTVSITTRGNLNSALHQYAKTKTGLEKSTAQ